MFSNQKPEETLRSWYDTYVSYSLLYMGLFHRVFQLIH